MKPNTVYPRTAEAASKIKSNTVENENGCWVWQGPFDTGGYGMSSLGSYLDGTHIQTGSHRSMYEAVIGPVPDGLVLDHLCRNRACANPSHLEPVTHAENMRRGEHATKAFCKWGHELTEENIYSPPAHPSWRYCRSCIARRQAQRQAAKESSRSTHVS